MLMFEWLSKLVVMDDFLVCQRIAVLTSPTAL